MIESVFFRGFTTLKENLFSLKAVDMSVVIQAATKQDFLQ